MVESQFAVLLLLASSVVVYECGRLSQLAFGRTVIVILTDLPLFVTQLLQHDTKQNTCDVCGGVTRRYCSSDNQPVAAKKLMHITWTRKC